MAGHKYARSRLCGCVEWRGQSMVELALTLPLLALILLGTVDLGRAFFYYTRLSNAVHQGALKGAYTPRLVTDDPNDPNIRTPTPISLADPSAYSTNNDSVKYRVKQEAQSALGLTNSNITVTCWQGPSYATQKKCSAATSGDLMVVRANYLFRPLTQQMVRILGSGYTMSKTVRMVVL